MIYANITNEVHTHTNTYTHTWPFASESFMAVEKNPTEIGNYHRMKTYNIRMSCDDRLLTSLYIVP